MVFDSLSNLSLYLVENHPRFHHLADLYELVQYAGNIVPRLYLMITVGTSYLQCQDSPREEILKDMIEMCQGVQNPIRGLFLRYYLSQTCKELLPADDPEFNCHFIIMNFIEMNKLWVRLQHQGPLREREQRTKERKELQILIGSQLVRLSQIVDDDWQLYKDRVLPNLLEQIVQCRDLVCQEYLLDILFQVFPDNFHLKSLKVLLKALSRLVPDVSIDTLLETLIDRLNGYVERKQLEGSASDSDDILKDKDLFQIFATFINKLNEERPDLPLQRFIGLIESLLNLSLKWYSDSYENLNKCFSLAVTKYNEYDKTIPSEFEYLFLDLLTLKKIKSFNERDLDLDSSFYFQLITQCESYRQLILIQKLPLQKTIINKLLDILITGFSSTDVKNFPQIESKAQLQNLLAICEPIIKLKERKTIPATKRHSATLKDFTKNSNINNNGNDNNDVDADTEDEDSDLIDEDTEMWMLNSSQEKITKFCHSLILSLSQSSTMKSVETQMESISIIRTLLLKGGKNIKYTFPAMITNYWRLIRRAHRLKAYLKTNTQYYDNLIKKTFKSISRCMNDLFNQCGNTFLDSIYKLNLQSASLADQLSLPEIAYDFFTQAFTVYEESLSDSKTQFQALVFMSQTLQKTRSLYKDSYYDSLIVRCTLHGSKLLKRQDQCRAIYLCSHLWWATEITSIGEEEGVTHDFHRDGKRVLECLQRSLRAADSIMDNIQSCELMIEILNRCLYYFIHGDESKTFITVKYINGLIELIKTNLKTLRLDKEEEENNMDSTDAQERRLTTYAFGQDGSCIHLSNLKGIPSTVSNKITSTNIADMIDIPAQNFERTCGYVIKQTEIDDRFKVIVI